jgi:hypothetical protein
MSADRSLSAELQRGFLNITRLLQLQHPPFT